MPPTIPAPTATAADRAQVSGRRGWRFLAVLALGLAALRFLRLGEWSLWHDEAIALSDALEGQGMANPLGYLFYRLSFAGAELRPSEFLLRLPAAVCGAIGVPLTFLVFRPFVPARQAAAAAILVGVSHWHVYWSQNARFYTLAMDLALIGGGLVLGGLLRGSAARVGGGIALLAAATSTHPSAAFLLVGALIGPWLARAFGMGPRPGPGDRAAWRLVLVALVVLPVAGLPWARDVWSTWVQKKDANPIHFVSTTGFYVSPYLGAGALCGALVALRRRTAFDAMAIATVLAALGAALVAAFLARMSAQYVFWALPWIALVAAAPLGAEARRGHLAIPRWTGTAYLALLVLPALANLALYFSVSHGDRPRWRDAYAYVQTHREPGDLILGMEAPVGEYYVDVDPARTDLRHWREVAYLDRFRFRLAEEWSRYPRRTWVVMNHEQLADWGSLESEVFLETLRQEFRWMASFQVSAPGRDLDVLVYLRE